MPGQWTNELHALLLVGTGGAIGSVARHLFGFLARIGGLPSDQGHLSTMAINATGSLVAGWLMRQFGPVNSAAFLFWGLGFCGGFTTFSSYSREFVTLMRDNRHIEAGAYMILSVALGVAGYIAGWSLAGRGG